MMTRSGPSQPRWPAGSYRSTKRPEATSVPSIRAVAAKAVANGASVRGAGTSSKASSGRTALTCSWPDRRRTTAARNAAAASSEGAATPPTCFMI